MSSHLSCTRPLRLAGPLFFAFTLAAVCAEPAPRSLTVDLEASSPYPEDHLKRGYVLQGAVAQINDDYVYSIRKSRQLGNDLIGIFRDVNQFAHKVLFRSYRSQGPGFFGADGQPEEFALEDGTIRIRANPQFLKMCRMARDGGMQLVIQVHGTPVEGLDDGSVRQLFTLDPKRAYHGQARYYPIPVEAEFPLLVETLHRWMGQITAAVGAPDTIWLGTQEPEHTLGFPGGVKDDNFRHQNLKDYIHLWSMLADVLHADGQLTGAIQNNAGQNSGEKFRAAVRELAAQGCSIDFFSIQNYSGQNNARILREAFEALDSQPAYRGKPVIFHRYQPGIEVERCFTTTAGLVEVLSCEKVLLDHADRVHGYNLHTFSRGSEYGENLLGFLNQMPPVRKTIAGLGEGIDGFAFAGNGTVCIALWNSSEATVQLDLNLRNGASSFPSLMAAGGFDNRHRLREGFAWDPDVGALRGLRLEPQSYAFLTFRAERAETAPSSFAAGAGGDTAVLNILGRNLLARTVRFSLQGPVESGDELEFLDESGERLVSLAIRGDRLVLAGRDRSVTVALAASPVAVEVVFSAASADVRVDDRWVANGAYAGTGRNLAEVRFSGPSFAPADLPARVKVEGFASETLDRKTVAVLSTAP